MVNQYKAVYYNQINRFYQATIFLSSITLSIRYTDENGNQKDVYWLAENILALEEKATATELHHKNATGPNDRLVIRDTELINAIKKIYRNYRFTGSFNSKFFGSTTNKIVLLFSILLTFILVAYFWFVPWLGQRIGNSVSKEWEIEMGDKMYSSVISSFTIDSNKSRLINEYYAASGFNVNYPVNITVVQSDEVNAFAIPGGHIVVYDAILDEMKTHNELGALLSHESSHIALRHSLKNMFRTLARKMFLLLIFGNESGITSFLADHADNLKGLEYSRALETEADDHGMKIMSARGIDPNGMIHLMELLQKGTKGKENAEFLSTHPVFSNRIRNIRKNIDRWPVSQIENKRLQEIFNELYE